MSEAMRYWPFVLAVLGLVVGYVRQQFQVEQLRRDAASFRDTLEAFGARVGAVETSDGYLRGRLDTTEHRIDNHAAKNGETASKGYVELLSEIVADVESVVGRLEVVAAKSEPSA